MKECRTCKTVKDLSEFPTQKKHGYRGTGEYTFRIDCRACVAANAREYRKTYKPQGRTVRKDVDKVLYSACQAKVQDARQRSKQIAIDTDFMYDLFNKQSGRCALSGMPMSLIKGNPDVLSIDQIYAGGGYSKDNVQWVRWDANRAKGDLPHDKFIELCRAIVRCNDYPEREYTQVSGSA